MGHILISDLTPLTARKTLVREVIMTVIHLFRKPQHLLFFLFLIRRKILHSRSFAALPEPVCKTFLLRGNFG